MCEREGVLALREEMAAGRKDSGGTEAERLALGQLAPSPH